MLSIVLALAINSSVRAQSNGEGAPAATPAEIEIPHVARITVQPVPGYGPAPLVAGFLVSSANPEDRLTSFRWDFGDGQVSTLPPTVLFHTYKNPGSYVVTVTATTADGRTASGFSGVIVTTPAQ